MPRRRPLTRSALAATAAALTLGGVLVQVGAASRATFAGTNGDFAFTRSPNLVVAGPDGRGQRAVVKGVRPADPAWSRNATRLAFASRGLSTANGDGTGVKRLTTNDLDTDPTWSPDASRIAFVRTDRRSHLFVISSAGGQATNLTPNFATDVDDPEWSPDGSKIAFSDRAAIFVINANGSGLKSLTSPATGGARAPSWSPDGSRIAFARLNALWMMAADGSGQTELLANRREMWDVAWSPDSTQIAFIDDPGGRFQEELFVINPDGSGVRRLNVDTETSFDWANGPPPPVVGKTFNAAAVSGVVSCRAGTAGSFRRVTATTQLRVGSECDATKGRVRIVSASGRARKSASSDGAMATTPTQSGVFYGGRFKVTQKRSATPVTELALAGGDFKSKCGRKKRSVGSTAAAADPPIRRLWGNGTGRFRTTGRYSLTNVTGTIWLTEDRCHSTVTTVKQGKVIVTDNVRRKRVTVRAGKTYVAKAPGRQRKAARIR